MSLFPGKIIYGTAWKKERTKALVVQAVLQGFRAIDTACQPKHYREDLVGEALEELYTNHGFKREDFVLQTKYTPIGGHDHRRPYNPTDPIATQVQDSFKKSLEHLKTNYLDSYLLHSPLPTHAQTWEAWSVLMKLQDEGLVKAIGLSNVYGDDGVKLLQFLERGHGAGRKVQVVQNRWHQGNGYDKAMVKYCLANGITYQSFWTLTGSPEVLRHPSLESIMQKKGITAAQAMYCVVQKGGIVPLAGSTNEQHMKDGVKTASVELSDEDVDGPLRAHLWE